MYQQSGTIDWETHPILLMTSSWQGGQKFILLLHYIWAAAWEGEETMWRNISESQKYRTKRWIKDRWNEKMILQLQPLNKCMQRGKTWRNNKLKVQFVRKVCETFEFQSISRNTDTSDWRPTRRTIPKRWESDLKINFPTNFTHQVKVCKILMNVMVTFNPVWLKSCRSKFILDSGTQNWVETT